MGTPFTPTADHVEKLVNHGLMYLVLRRALKQFANMNNIPATEQATLVFNKLQRATKKA